MDWTEKYRPRSLDDLVGNGPAVKKLRDWAAAWTKGVPKKRAVVLAGTPGTGKTSAALALAADMDWAVIELNASDARNADTIKRVATAGALHQTFGDDGAFHAHTDSEAGRKLIILDEADNLYERLAGENAAGGGSDLSDKGGKTQIIDTIRRTQQPIVLIVNDLYALTKGSGSALKSLAETLKFSRVNVRSIPKALERIVRAEGIQVDRPVLEAIADRAGGDLRAAVRDLESLCAGRSHVTLQDLGSMGYRDTTGNIFDAVRHVLKGRAWTELRREIRDVDATPEDIVLWIDENMPKEYQAADDLVRGYEALSRADIFLGRTRRTQNYRLWAYASDMATGGVMAARQHQYKKFVPYGFPQYLSKMARSRGARQVKDQLAEALGRATHASKRKTRNETVPVFEALFRDDPEFAARQTYELDLDEGQVAVLLQTQAGTKKVQTILEAADALRIEEAAKAEARSRPKTVGGLGDFEGSDAGPEVGSENEQEQKEEEPAETGEEGRPSSAGDGGQQRLF